MTKERLIKLAAQAREAEARALAQANQYAGAAAAFERLIEELGQEPEPPNVQS